MAWFPSGQREQTVNLPALAFECSNHSHATIYEAFVVVVVVVVSGCSSVGRAPAFQAGGREFESRRPLHFFSLGLSSRGSVVEYFLGKEGVASSILAESSIIPGLELVFFYCQERIGRAYSTSQKHR